MFQNLFFQLTLPFHFISLLCVILSDLNLSEITWVKHAEFTHVRVAVINRFCWGTRMCCLVFGFFSGICVLSLGFNTGNCSAPIGLISQETDVWIPSPMGSSVVGLPVLNSQWKNRLCTWPGVPSACSYTTRRTWSCIKAGFRFNVRQDESLALDQSVVVIYDDDGACAYLTEAPQGTQLKKQHVFSKFEVV